MSKREASRYVHKAIRRLEDAESELSEEELDESEMLGSVEDCREVLELIKENLKPEGQKNIGMFS